MAGHPPFSRRRRRDGEPAPDPDWEHARAVEFLASAYGWGPDYLAEHLTDEQLLLYLDAAQDRIDERHRSEFEGAVEAARLGAIFAEGKAGQRQYDRWKARLRNARGARGLTGQALEQVVMALARSHPEYVVMG